MRYDYVNTSAHTYSLSQQAAALCWTREKCQDIFKPGFDFLTFTKYVFSLKIRFIENE